MSSLNTALYIGTSGMQVSQSALATVSHNVVNANNVGYSRQIVTTSASSANGFGTGVQIDAIQRASDRFLTARVLTATSDANYANTASSYFSSLEQILSNSSATGGLQTVVGGFITSLNNLSADPSNSSLRRSAVQQAGVTATALNNTAADLKNTAITADNAITADLDSANQLLKDIYTLNTQIEQLQSTGNGAGNSDLLDARDQKIAQLSQDFGLQVNTNTTTGAVRITTENGRKLVDDTGYVQLSRGTSGGAYRSIVAQNVQQDGTVSPSQLPIDTDELTTGSIKALVDVRDTTVPNLLAQVDQFTNTFKAAVNQLSSQGTSFPPTSTVSSGNTGILGTTGANLLTTPGFTGISGSTLNISVTNSLGNVVTTTVGGTAITLAPTPPATTLSLSDIANIINNDPTIGNTALGGTNGVIATATTDSNGKPYLSITSANPNNKVVLSNGTTGDAVGTLGMNNLFTGTDASTIAVRSDIATNPDLLPVARMRADGGVSSTDGQNIVPLAALADTKLNFGSAGGLGAQNATGVSYLNTVASNLAVSVSAANDNATFTTNIQTQASDLATSVSGVNINEELSQMLIYQNSFQASARIISIVNDLMQTLINTIQ